jgi:hypothetical protein
MPDTEKLSLQRIDFHYLLGHAPDSMVNDSYTLYLQI